MEGLPTQYEHLKSEYPRFMNALEELGQAVQEEGPLDKRTGHLVQLAAAAALHSEGSVHSHTRRALAAGATAAEIRHAVVLLTSPMGFPKTSAALSWVDDILEAR